MSVGLLPWDDRAEEGVLHALRDRVAPLTGMLRVEVDPADRDGWIDLAALGNPTEGPLADLAGRFMTAGFGVNRRAVAASLLLRYGWAAGPIIAAWLACGRVLKLSDFALKFSPSTLVEAVWMKAARIELPADRQAGRAALLVSLLAFSAPLVASQHQWSRFSRHALWSMVVSSWAAQFSAIGDRLGMRETALAETRALFGLDREIAAAAPELYEVGEGERSRVCQKRSACCLYFKGPARHFCASCPIIPREERLARNRDWVSATD